MSGNNVMLMVQARFYSTSFVIGQLEKVLTSMTMMMCLTVILKLLTSIVVACLRNILLSTKKNIKLGELKILLKRLMIRISGPCLRQIFRGKRIPMPNSKENNNGDHQISTIMDSYLQLRLIRVCLMFLSCQPYSRQSLF